MLVLVEKKRKVLWVLSEHDQIVDSLILQTAIFVSGDGLIADTNDPGKRNLRNTILLTNGFNLVRLQQPVGRTILRMTNR